jgi:20S proteasome alpha/beta subunit
MQYILHWTVKYHYFLGLGRTKNEPYISITMDAIVELSFFAWISFLFSFLTLSVHVQASTTSETLIGITGSNFVLLASDGGISSSGGGSVAYTSTYVNKLHMLQPNTLIGAVGNAADTDRLVSILRAECNIYNYESMGYRYDVHRGSSSSSSSSSSCNGVMEVVDCRASARSTHAVTTVPPPLSSSSSQLSSQLSFLAVDCIAQMARNKIAERLRTSSPYSVCALIAGMKRREAYSTTKNNDVPTDHHGNNHHDNPIITTTTVAQRIQQQVTAATLSFQPPQDTRHVPVEQRQQQYSSQSESPEATILRPVLYWLDEYGSMIGHVPYGVHGYAADMLWSILDNGYRPDMSLSDAIQLLQECMEQLKTRYVMNSQSTKFCVQYVDAQGCHGIDV